MTWVKKFGNQSEQNVASVLSRSGEACHQGNGQVILQEGNNCVLVYCRKKKEGVYLKMYDGLPSILACRKQLQPIIKDGKGV